LIIGDHPVVALERRDFFAVRQVKAGGPHKSRSVAAVSISGGGGDSPQQPGAVAFVAYKAG